MEGLDNFLNESKNSSFDIEVYQDGKLQKHGNEYGLDISQVYTQLIYEYIVYDENGDEFEDDEDGVLYKKLSKLKKGKHVSFKDSYDFDIRVTRKS